MAASAAPIRRGDAALTSYHKLVLIQKVSARHGSPRANKPSLAKQGRAIADPLLYCAFGWVMRWCDAAMGEAFMEIRDYLDVLRRGWWIILGVTVAVSGLTALYTFTRTPLYESQAKVFVSLQSTANIQDLIQGNVFTQQATQGYAEVAATPIVLDTVIKELGLGTTSSELAARINASAPLQSDVLSIRVRDESPDVAVAIANGVSARLSDVAGDLTSTAGGTSPVKITLIQPAVASPGPVTPKVPLYLLLGTAGGVVVGFGAAAFLVRQNGGPRRGKRLK
jgi:capsular polysaccharide biosynthesis protein